MLKKTLTTLLSAALLSACVAEKENEAVTTNKFTGKPGEVKFMNLDPGHFHAALVQKSMYAAVDSTVYVYAPDGAEVQDYFSKIDSYNARPDNPTTWNTKAYLGNDYLEKMIADKPGNVMIVAGKNSKKIDYILAAVKAGINVYADKPLVINPAGYEKLQEAFKIAEKNGVMIYDIMTERFEETTALQKEFSMISSVFGELVDGTPDEPAISKESIHHFSKIVSGKPLVRPPWFFDVNEEGEGIVDVTTHLVDLVQWEAFPDQIIKKSDIELLKAKHWNTGISPEQFKEATGLDQYPDYLKRAITDGKLNVLSNGEIIYKIKGKHAKVSVIWNFEAPPGTGDTHYSIMRGTKCNLIIEQGAKQNYKPTLYIKIEDNRTTEKDIQDAVSGKINDKFAGVTVEKVSPDLWKVIVPEKYKMGHEAHFGEVTKNYLTYLQNGKLPDWEKPNMLTKYYITTEAYRMAQKSSK